MEFVFVFLIAAAVFALVIGRSKKSVKARRSSRGSAKRSSKSSLQARSPYRATSIAYDDNACEAVRAIGGKRFLDVEKNIPLLPMPDCDLSTCNCKYARHGDRRESNEDRRHPSGLKSELYDRTGAPNKRLKKSGRRKGDWA